MDRDPFSEKFPLTALEAVFHIIRTTFKNGPTQFTRDDL